MLTRKIDNKLSLSLVCPKDAEEVSKLIEKNRAYLSEFMPWAMTTTKLISSQVAIQSLHNYAEGKEFPCNIRHDGEIVGSINLKNINKFLSKADLGYWLDKDHQGKGIITRCVKKMIDIGFNELSLSKIEIKCATHNIPSRAIPERLGFTLEGIITQEHKVNDAIFDLAVYGLHKMS